MELKATEKKLANVEPTMPGIKYNDVEESMGGIAVKVAYEKKDSGKSASVSKNGDIDNYMHLVIMAAYTNPSGDNPWHKEGMDNYDAFCAGNLAALLNEGDDEHFQTIVRKNLVGTPENQELVKGGAK